MAIAVLAFPNNDTPIDLLLWAVYHRQVAGLVESAYAANPGLAELDFWPAAGTTMSITIPAKTAPAPVPVLRLY